jgi:signal transduction histidine kinase
MVHPRKWPVRWRIAATSAGLTLVILLIFGVGIGEVAGERVRSDFNHEVRGAAQTLAAETTIAHTPTGSLLLESPVLNDFARPNDATARIFDSSGHLLESNANGTNLGPLRSGLTSVNGMRVAVFPISSSGVVTGYAQYGRSLEHIDSTIDRLWLLVAAGVLIGTALASLAGVTIAGRAMRPISSLTATAREIAATGDPSRHMPKPQADDEVGELGRTLEQMLRSLDAARAEREQAMTKQREFVADASHELRTPLTSILANLELLQASLNSPGHEDDRAMVDSALRSSGRMSRLVADLLLLARADAGRHGARTRCDLAEVAGAAAVEVAPTMGGRELLVENERPLPVEGNADELHRMVLNLLDNAVRHGPAEGTVELRLREEENEAIVEVADDGPGVPVELRDAVFDRFVRGDGPADTAVGGGSGLGLAIVRAVAASHGGRAEATESDRGGALFRVSIPLDHSASQAGGVVKGPLPAA